MASSRRISPDVQRLRAMGLPGGPSCEEALRVFARARSTADESAAIEALVSGRTGALPEPLLVAVGSALIDRGEESAAARLLSNASSSPALIVRSDLLARAGEWAAAMALVERVLSRDIHWPGARDRHSRCRQALGLAQQPARPDPSATVVVAAPKAPFRVLREVGRGATGTVYEVEDRDLGRHVALKIYHRPDRDWAQLLHEARVAAALAGPGVVRVFDLHPEHGWLAMEWAPSGTLRSALQSSGWGQPGNWATPLARSLARVHEAGWVHHDLKPANVLFLSNGRPLLSDFGSARRVGEPSPPGSFGYVSPERLAGRSSDARDDVYGFGRVLEDALESLDEVAADAQHWRELASACTGPDDSRPRDGGKLLLVLDGMRGY
ncbi:MAG: serine/threonine protein kinase [Myxococcota bacterium]|nr:serine/threonine protein kinase [Myxococcota bacterium]